MGDVGEATFVEGYGMVEVGGGVAAKLSPPFLPLGVGETVGFRLPGYKFRVVDESDPDPNAPRCLIAVRGRQPLTASVRDLGVSPVPIRR